MIYKLDIRDESFEDSLKIIDSTYAFVGSLGALKYTQEKLKNSSTCHFLRLENFNNFGFSDTEVGLIYEEEYYKAYSFIDDFLVKMRPSIYSVRVAEELVNMKVEEYRNGW